MKDITKAHLLLAGIIIASATISISYIMYMSDMGSQEQDKKVIFQIQFITSTPEEVDGRFFVKKGDDWIMYAELNQPYWTNVGKIEHKDGAIFKELPNISHLAIQFWTTEQYTIKNITGDGNYTRSIDINNNEKADDHVFIKEIEWDDSEPTIPKEWRTETIHAVVQTEKSEQHQDIMKMNIQTIINIVQKYPSLLTDDEVDILLSQAVGKGFGMVDHKVDDKAQKIMWRVLEHLTKNGESLDDFR